MMQSYSMMKSGENMNRILVVEDEEPILNLIRISLKEAGYECIGMTTGHEAIDLIS
ncbi:hypothetical protein ACTNC9_07005 [Catenibacterium mitsuokai]|uniref:hypothetical protein n=1 Tax=Catenibacterium mitsuokai TaxID=100886 RepID=UPI003F88E924